MSWKYVDDLLLKLSKNSTFFGKIWILSILIFRLLVLTAFGEHVWSDEQREFTCNTKQPGCENVCFNEFTPVSNIRLWGLQLLSVSVPGAFYFLYVLHVIARNKIITSRSTRFKDGGRDASADDVIKPSQENMKPLEGARKRWKLLSGHVIPSELHKSRVRCVWRLYLLQIILRVAIECLFALLQYEIYFYRWTVPEVFACSRWPCPHTVDCFISRPHEKTVFFRYMFAVCGLSVLISLAELLHIGWANLRKVFDSKRKPNSQRSRKHFINNTTNKLKSNLYVTCHNKETIEKMSQIQAAKAAKSKSYHIPSSENSSVLASKENSADELDHKDSNRISYL